MEHHVSEETLQRFSEFTRKFGPAFFIGIEVQKRRLGSLGAGTAPDPSQWAHP
jgi:hypothetical protein